MERQVIVAKSAGFCFGVERAVARVYEQIQAVKEGKAQGPIYTYGPIIHNEEVVRDLEEKDVQVLDTEEDLENLPGNRDHPFSRSQPSCLRYLKFPWGKCGRCHLPFCKKDP